MNQGYFPGPDGKPQGQQLRMTGGARGKQSAPGQTGRQPGVARAPAGRGRKPRRPGRALLYLLVLALLVAGGLYGAKALRDGQIRQELARYREVYPPNIFINDIPLEGLTPNQAKEKLRESIQQNIGSWSLSITYKGFTFYTLSYSELGINVTDDELHTLLNTAWLHTRSGTIYQQKAAIDALSAGQALRLGTSQQSLQGGQLQQIMGQIVPYVNQEPMDAALIEFRPDEADPFVFQDERLGARLDVQAAVDDILAMAANGQSGSYELKPEILQPEVTRSQLEDTVRLRTSITTAIASSSPDNRNHNIRLSLSKFNGMILRPGQSFSFNDVVGPRTLKAGFREALEYAYGNLEIGIGGGVCQASTTLYQAALTAGLTISKRYPHSGPVDYTQLGQDATVFLSRDRNLDFQFRNTTPGSIYITAHVTTARNSSKRLVAVINMYGLSLGDGVTYKLRSDVVRVIKPPEEKKYVPDKEGLYVTYTDEEKLKSKAVDGQVIETYLEKYQNGVLVDQPKLLTSDTFEAKPAEYWRGIHKRTDN